MIMFYKKTVTDLALKCMEDAVPQQIHIEQILSWVNFDGSAILYLALSFCLAVWRVFLPVSYMKTTFTAPSLRPYVVLVKENLVYITLLMSL